MERPTQNAAKLAARFAAATVTSRVRDAMKEV